MKNTEYRITDLIPQRPPIIMVDKIVFCDDKTTITKFFIKSDNIFCYNNKFREPGLIENIAQSAAARAGFLNKQKNGRPEIGFIGSIKDLTIYFLPDANSEITTEITFVGEVLDFTIIAGKTICNDKTVAECEMRIFIKHE